MGLLMTKGYIETRDTYFNDEREAAQRNVSLEEARRMRVQIFLTGHRLPIVTDWTIKGTVEAEIHQGKWIAECPLADCYGAEFVTPDWPLFVCSGSCGHGPLRVVFPRAREAIESELLKRPVPATRGWRRGEKVADLRRENKEKGIG